jgi:hypothetical protein
MKGPRTTAAYSPPRHKWGVHAVAGPVTLGDILDLVGAAGDDQSRIDAQLKTLYDWHHARGLAVMQLAFAPAAVAALTIVARGATTAVIIVAAVLLLAAVGVGIWRVVELNRFDREYIFALQLAALLAPYRQVLAPTLHDDSLDASGLVALPWPPADGNPVGMALHSELRSIPMFLYRSKPEVQERVRAALESARRSESARGR